MKLAGVINYAITSHVVDLDERLGKKLYGEAVHLKLPSYILTNILAVNIFVDLKWIPL